MKKLHEVTNRQKTNFTMVSNMAIDDKELSIDALGLYVKMLRKPPKWKFYNNSLAKECGIGRDKLVRLLKELHEKGWVIKNGQINVKGVFGGNIYMIEFEK